MLVLQENCFWHDGTDARGESGLGRIITAI
jgi:hypothetical protein